jgi:hypothetical protein
VHREALAGGAEVRRRAERICEHHDPGFRPPERNLLPSGNPEDAEKGERRARDACEGNDVERHVEARRHLGTVPLVAVE